MSDKGIIEIWIHPETKQLYKYIGDNGILFRLNEDSEELSLCGAEAQGVILIGSYNTSKQIITTEVEE